jgi:deazaflavin-dependent oxidoreductase (nitroreductase family)
VDAAAGHGGQIARVPAREQRQAQVEREIVFLAAEQYLYLTTRGRLSGLPRQIEIWFTEREGRFYVIAEYATSHWVRNIQANPDVKVGVSGEEFPARARIVAQDEGLYREIQELSRAKYGWGDGLVVELGLVKGE